GWRSVLCLGVGAGTVGALAGFLVGVPLGRRLPVQLRGYSPSRGTLQVRFRNPEYGAAVWQLMRQRLRAARRPMRGAARTTRGVRGWGRRRPRGRPGRARSV